MPTLKDGAPWELVHWVRRRRPLLTALVVLAAAAHALLAGAPPTDLLLPRWEARYVIAWALMLLGAGVRVWAAGNLRKDQEITERGVYALVRHPLYLGSLAFFLAFFLTVGDLLVGLILFAALVCLVYYPTMRAEEEQLRLRFPGQFARYRPPPRLLPAFGRAPGALRTNRFQLQAAQENYGMRSLLFLVALPLALRLLGWLGRELGRFE